MGIFITFEGIDGCGKSTQVKLLDHALKEKKIETCVTMEPGGTEAGKIIRNILLGSEFSVDRYAQLFLFVADRAQHLEEVIRPALMSGKWVLCDRFVESTVAYQGYGLGLNKDFINLLHKEILGDTWPDLTFVLDCPVSVARLRLKTRRGETAELTSGKGDDPYETASLEFQERLRQGYLDLARKYPKRIALIDGSEDPKQVHLSIIKIIEKKKLWPSET